MTHLMNESTFAIEPRRLQRAGEKREPSHSGRLTPIWENTDGGERGLRAWPSTRDDEIQEAAEGVGQQENNPQNARPSALAKVRLRRSAASSWKDPGPAPDGGKTAWIQVFCTFLTVNTTFGFFTSFGVYQTYYETSLGISPSTISWIGSIAVFLLFGIGTLSGRATDAGLFRPVYIAGAVFQMVGIFTMAESTQLWQLFLSHGVCLGIANGLQFCPSMALVSTYFVKKRALAMGITALGSCTGGILFPIIAQQCLPRIGFPWTIRIIGFIMLVLNAITIALYRTRLPPRRSGPIVDWESFRDTPFSLYCVAMFFSFWGLYFAFFYIGSYGRNVLGASYKQSINLLMVQVSMGFVFRLLPSYIADKIGALNVLIPFAFICGIAMFGWIGIHSVGALYVFAVVYGSSSAVIQALWPAIIGSCSRTPDLKKAGVRMGMAFTVVSFASFTGPPMAGALIQRSGGSYTYANIWAGTSFFVGGALLILTRFALVGRDWRAKI
ncbi:MFS general substrate transporter [Polyplosphaeria fusca]|uniref:MFS general substrate transporter n=1 Tax=Polyplosphaeria fusca TaxID=682080 RepID=A0A9P4V5S9_9PLEO|nr:MFS general substrate transporter [Polyplosphaeria fusca]